MECANLPSWPASKFKDPPASATPALRVQACITTPNLYTGAGDLNSGIPACVVSTLLV